MSSMPMIAPGPISAGASGSVNTADPQQAGAQDAFEQLFVQLMQQIQAALEEGQLEQGLDGASLPQDGEGLPPDLLSQLEEFAAQLQQPVDSAELQQALEQLQLEGVAPDQSRQLLQAALLLRDSRDSSGAESESLSDLMQQLRQVESSLTDVEQTADRDLADSSRTIDELLALARQLRSQLDSNEDGRAAPNGLDQNSQSVSSLLQSGTDLEGADSVRANQREPALDTQQAVVGSETGSSASSEATLIGGEAQAATPQQEEIARQAVEKPEEAVVSSVEFGREEGLAGTDTEPGVESVKLSNQPDTSQSPAQPVDDRVQQAAVAAAPVTPSATDSAARSTSAAAASESASVAAADPAKPQPTRSAEPANQTNTAKADPLPSDGRQGRGESSPEGQREGARDQGLARWADLRDSVVAQGQKLVQTESAFRNIMASQSTVVQQGESVSLAQVSSNASLTQLQQAYQGNSQSGVTLGLGERFGGERWGAAASQRIVWMAGQNVGHAELRLDPPELGSLNVRLHLQGEQASLSFTSPHAHVRDTLEQQMPRLREMLAESGIELADSDVSDQSQPGASEERGYQAENADSELADLELASIADEQLSGARMSLSLVDYYA